MQQATQINKTYAEQPVAGTTHVTGALELSFRYDQEQERTNCISKRQQPPLKVIRAFPLAAGGALVHLHNTSGGILGGDQLYYTFQVGTHAYAQLTTTSATRIYRRRPQQAPACQIQKIIVEEQGLLEYLPDPIIPFAGAAYQQHTTIELATGAGLFYWETITPGRVASDELFRYDQLQIHCDITAADRPILSEHLALQPQQRSLSTPAQLGPYLYFSSFYICKVGLPSADWQHLESELQVLAQQLTIHDEIIWGVSTLVQHGLIVRALSKHGRDIAPGLLEFWRAGAQALYGRAVQLPRKVY